MFKYYEKNLKFLFLALWVLLFINPVIAREVNSRYVVHNDAPDPGKELYSVHRVIKVWEYDVKNDQVIEGTDKIIVDGGVDLADKPIWIEAPHIYKKNGRFYLMCAEGGTGDWRSEVILSVITQQGHIFQLQAILFLPSGIFRKIAKIRWTGPVMLI